MDPAHPVMDRPKTVQETERSDPAGPQATPEAHTLMAPGRIISTPKAQHLCTGKPIPSSHAQATIWQCDECEKQWVLVVGAQYNESYSVWRPLTAHNRDGTE